MLLVILESSESRAVFCKDVNPLQATPLSHFHELVSDQRALLTFGNEAQPSHKIRLFLLLSVSLPGSQSLSRSNLFASIPCICTLSRLSFLLLDSPPNAYKYNCRHTFCKPMVPNS